MKKQTIKKLKIKEQVQMIEKHLVNAEEYLAQNINVDSSSWLHLGDWRGRSGHPSWMRNWMIPSLKKSRARKEKALEIIDKKAKDKNLLRHRRQEGSA